MNNLIIEQRKIILKFLIRTQREVDRMEIKIYIVIVDYLEGSFDTM